MACVTEKHKPAQLTCAFLFSLQGKLKIYSSSKIATLALGNYPIVLSCGKKYSMIKLVPALINGLISSCTSLTVKFSISS